jgi:hypothetical protein
MQIIPQGHKPPMNADKNEELNRQDARKFKEL